ncbi:hypothetical protein DFJ63DRAFT_313966 [Scheffersomyces coipomensis]|uniref:uncharacterized protein n=1 Tax=Scheffersomyces coipomensis TaxID=1788519 RepID=UPI00315D9104
MSGQTYFITGANRGIGFEITKYLLASNPDHKIIATARDASKATALKALSKNVIVFPLDLGDQKTIDAIPSELEKINIDTIDVFISNAGISDSYYTVLECSKETWLEHYEINALAPILIFQQVYKALSKSSIKKAIFVSSGIGSLTRYIPSPVSAYAQSKAALNFSVIELSAELKSEGFTIAAISPGVVSTDMGAYAQTKFNVKLPEFAPILSSLTITPEESGTAVGKVAETLSEEDHGKFLNYDHTVIPY